MQLIDETSTLTQSVSNTNNVILNNPNSKGQNPAYFQDSNNFSKGYSQLSEAVDPVNLKRSPKMSTLNVDQIKDDAQEWSDGVSAGCNQRDRTFR